MILSIILFFLLISDSVLCILHPILHIINDGLMEGISHHKDDPRSPWFKIQEIQRETDGCFLKVVAGGFVAHVKFGVL